MTTTVQVTISALTAGLPDGPAAHEAALLLIEYIKTSDEFKAIGELSIVTKPPFIMNNTTEFGQVNDPRGAGLGITEVIPGMLAAILEDTKQDSLALPESISEALSAAGDLNLGDVSKPVLIPQRWSDRVVEAKKPIALDDLITPGTTFRELGYREDPKGSTVIYVSQAGTVRQYVPST